MQNEQELREYIETELAAWQVPGAGVALIQNDRVVLCDGFGLRDREKELPFTADTLIPIASVSKSFTALSVGLLVDEGRLAWDTPVREFLPSFRLYDSVASERVTPRDLLCHRTGVPRHDGTWFNSNFTREELMPRLRYLEPSRDLRTAYQYNNLMFMAAGFLVGEIAGMSWESYVRQRLFEPLGMKRSNHSTVVTAADPDHATGYVEIEDVIGPVPYHEQDAEKHAIGPAGNICSSARDLAAYVRMHLAGGVLDGKRIVSEASVTETRRPQIVVPSGGRIDAATGSSLPQYGLGWGIQSWKGRLMVQHSGGMPGIGTLIVLLPDEGVGAVVLTNQGWNAMPTILAFGLLERLLDIAPRTDYSGIFRPLYEEGKAATKAGKANTEAERVPEAPPSHSLSAYCGDYEHPGYGIATVEAVKSDENRLRLTFNDKMEFTLAPYHFDVFQAHHAPLDIRYKVRFSTDTQGNIALLTAPLEPTVPDIIFTRLPDRALRDRSRWSDYAGTFDLMGRPVSIIQRADASLAVTLAGDIARALTPYRAEGETIEFTVEGRNGLRLAFTRDRAAEGAVTALTFITGGAVLTAKRS
jgi:CubicO group peptidase (beta-lactamase class C family)